MATNAGDIDQGENLTKKLVTKMIAKTSFKTAGKMLLKIGLSKTAGAATGDNNY